MCRSAQPLFTSPCTPNYFPRVILLTLSKKNVIRKIQTYPCIGRFVSHLAQIINAACGFQRKQTSLACMRGFKDNPYLAKIKLLKIKSNARIAFFLLCLCAQVIHFDSICSEIQCKNSMRQYGYCHCRLISSWPSVGELTNQRSCVYHILSMVVDTIGRLALLES